jgi:hypothetical protein
LQWYTELVESHLRAIIRHREGLDYEDGQALQDTSTWLDWTTQDQSRFFAALSRHSRLRADLVAEDCNKPESEVLLYLDSLDRGLAKIVGKDQSDQDGRRNRGRREGKAKSAREVTESWIQEEERLAGYLIQDATESDRLEEEVQMSKRRRIKRTAMKVAVRNELGDKAERRKLREEKTIEMQSRWAREDWGRSIGWERLGQLDKLTRPSWSEWYGDRVRRVPGRLIKVETPDTPEPPASPNPSRKLTKHDKIAIDNATLEALLAIDKPARTPEQRANLTKLLNRKRNRENTRMQSLLHQGKSEEEIEQEGGVDKAYLKSIGKDVNAETPPDDSADIATLARSGTPLPRRLIRQSSTSRQATPMDTSTVSEDDAALQDLRNIGLDSYLASENLDIVNFAALASQYTGPDVSLPILHEITESVKDYLRYLVLQSITLADMEALQAGDDDQPGIESHHVEYAIATLDGFNKGGSRVSLYPHDIDNPELAEKLTSEADGPSLTDEEDDELDRGATNLDEKLDSAAELALWQAAEEFSLPDIPPDNIIASRTGKSL